MSFLKKNEKGEIIGDAMGVFVYFIKDYNEGIKPRKKGEKAKLIRSKAKELLDGGYVELHKSYQKMWETENKETKTKTDK